MIVSNQHVDAGSSVLLEAKLAAIYPPVNLGHKELSHADY